MPADITPIVLAIIGGGGVIGGIATLLKLKPEANSAAVSAASNALESMQRLIDELEEALDRERAGRLSAEEKVAVLESTNRHLKEIIAGVAMMEDPNPGERKTPS
jgi:threonine dehydratase